MVRFSLNFSPNFSPKFSPKFSPNFSPNKRPAAGHQARFKLDPNTAWLVLFCQVANLFTVVNELSSWMLAIIALCLCWRALMVHDERAKPAFGLLVLFALGGCLALAFSGAQLGLLSSMLHLLCFAYALKTLEMSSRKDFLQLILIGLLLLAVAFIFGQSLLFALTVALIMVLNLAVLMRYFTPERKLLTLHKNAARLLLQSLPLAIVLFIVFPRLAPFWQVPQAQSSKTGMSDSVKPGDIAKLALSDDLAYRASFQGKQPEPNQLYWRAMVLENYDGRSWTPGITSRQQARQIISGRATYRPVLNPVLNPMLNPVAEQGASGQPDNKARLVYQVTAQASYQPWLFALDLARVNQTDIVHLPDHSLRSKKPLTKTLSYQVVSYTAQPLDLLPAEDMLKRNLIYPEGVNPRLQQEASRLRQTHTSDISLVQAVLAKFRQQNYHYTLQPPPLNNNSLDQFYFDTKAGFCEHYASAFSYLMRASGIPARMVIGYLGGEYNDEGDYFSIYQYDAHAWVEIWQPDRGWLRVDPTAAVSPDRVENGLSSRLLQEQSLLGGNLLSLHRYRHLAWINTLRLKLDAMDYQWTRLVLSYSAKRQYDLLENLLGRVLPWKIAALVVGALGVIFLAFWLLNQGKSRRKAVSPWLALYQQALVLLAKKGLVKPTAMPAKTFAVQAGQALPGLTDCFMLLSNDFEANAYQNLNPAEQQQRLTRMKQNLKLLKTALKSQPNVHMP